MPKLFSGMIVASFLMLFLFQSATGFERYMGARPQGMGDAFIALANDMNTLNYNPAGLALEKNLEASLEYANLYPGLDEGLIQENHLLYAQSLAAAGGLGIGWNNRSLWGTYNENEFILGYAREISPWPLQAGLAAKIFYLNYSDAAGLKANEYFANGSSKLQVGFDFGLRYEFFPVEENMPRYAAGITLLNFNEPDIGLKAEARELITIGLGTSVLYGEWDGAVDFTYKDSKYQVHVGAEKWWEAGTWGARTGLIIGAGDSFMLTTGGSYAFSIETNLKLRINYAFQYPFNGILATAGIHRLAIDVLYPLTTGAGSTGKVFSEDEVIRIQNYLLQRIDEYLLIAEKLRQLKTMPAVKKSSEMELAEQKMHESVGQLILYQNISGFLGKFKEALSIIKSLEKYQELIPERGPTEKKNMN